MSALKEIIEDYVATEKSRGESKEQIEADLAFYIDEALNLAFSEESRP